MGDRSTGVGKSGALSGRSAAAHAACARANISSTRADEGAGAGAGTRGAETGAGAGAGAGAGCGGDSSSFNRMELRAWRSFGVKRAPLGILTEAVEGVVAAGFAVFVGGVAAWDWADLARAKRASALMDCVGVEEAKGGDNVAGTAGVWGEVFCCGVGTTVSTNRS